MKRSKFTVILSAVIIVSMLFSSFCVSASTATSKEYYYNNGSNLIAVRGDCGLESELVANPEFRASGDSAVHISGTSTVDTTDPKSGYNYLWPYNSDIKETTYKKTVVSFDFMLKNDGTGVGMRATQMNGARTTFFKITAGEQVNAGTWNRVALVLSSDGVNFSYDVILNGTKIGGDNAANGSYGLRSNAWITCNVSKDAEFDMYIDNISYIGCDTYTMGQKPQLSSSSDEISVTQGYVSVGSGMTVSEVADLLLSENAQISFYGSDSTQLSSDAVLSGGEKIVAVSNEGIYNFYSVIMSLEKHWNGADTIKKTTTLGGMTIESNLSGAPVKANGDSVYKISGTASTDMSYTAHGQGFVNLDMGSLIGDTKQYDSFLVEFDFLLTYEGTGVFFRGQQCIEGQTSYTGTDRQDFALVRAGNTYGDAELESGKWQKLTIISDADNSGSDKGLCRVYLNGALIEEVSLKENAYGFYQFGWICPLVEKDGQFEMYLDNIRVSAGAIAGCEYTAAYLEGFTNELVLNEEKKRVYNAKSVSKVSDISGNALSSDNTAAVYVTDVSGAIQMPNAAYNTGFEIVLVSDDGLYTYYGISAGKDYAYSQQAVLPESSPLYAVSAQSDTPFYAVNTKNAEISVEFNRGVNTVTAQNIYLTCESETVPGVTLTPVNAGDGVQSVVITAASLESGKEYTININGLSALMADGTTAVMSGAQSITFVTKTYSSGEDTLMPNMIKNVVASSAYDGWSHYGGTAHTLNKSDDVITTSNRTNAWQGIQQIISYDKYYKYTGDEPGDTSKFNFSYKIKMDCTDGEYAKITFVWYVDGVQLTPKNYVLNAGDGSWKDMSSNIEITVPTEVAEASSAYLRIHIEGKKQVDAPTAFNDFSICDFSVRKYLPASEINLNIDEDTVIRSIDGSAFGYAYEEDEWYYSSAGAVVVSKTSNQFKQSFLDYADGLGIESIRIGGYLSNYDFWKCSIGPLESRIPTKVPAPAWDTSKDYWRDDIEYIGTLEGLDLAETINQDASIIMCTNIWSYLKDIDYSQTYTEAIEPSYIVDVATQTIDYSALDIAINDILDFVRFATLMPNDAKAVGTDGVNWAQRRVDLGHSEPYNITVWELGNELELRGVNGSTYADMCEYIVPKLRAEFPDIKLSVCADTLGDSINWTDELMTSVDYVSTHKYYDYDAIDSNVSKLAEIEAKINNCSNPNLKILITEGGLDTFRDYVGPSNRSMAMCTSYAYFMNRAAHFETLDSFLYYGNPSQFSYNAGEGFSYGWRYYNDSSLEVTEETDGDDTVVAVSGRKRYQSGMQQGIPLSKFTEQGHSIGETERYNISYKIKLTNASASVEPITVKFEWHRDSSSTVVSTVYSEVISGYASDEWIEKSADVNITIPEELADADGANMLIRICGNASSEVLSDIRVKNLNVSKGADGANLALNRSNILSTENDDFRNTALADVIQYYSDNAAGDIVLTSNNAITSSVVSQMAVKTENGLRLFISNLDDKSDYKINLISDKSYALSGKFIVYADSLYSERSPSANDIYTLREYYSSTEAIDSITIPKNSVMVVELTDLSVSDGTKIAQTIAVEGDEISINGENNGEKFDLVARFESDDKENTAMFIRQINADDRSIDIKFSDLSEYNKMALFKWDMDTLTPLAEKETYNLGRMFPKIQ